MRFEIKICGVTTEAALHAAVECGATAIGFVFAPSVRRVSIEQAAALSRVTPRGVARVAVFRRPGVDEVARVLAAVAIDRVQSDAGDLPAIAAVLGDTPFMPVYRDSPDLQKEMASLGGSGRALIEGQTSGSGITPDWDRIAAIRHVSCILAGGLHAGNVAEAIGRVRPVGVDASSGVESAPGVKDPRRICEFVTKARAAFESLTQETNRDGV